MFQIDKVDQMSVNEMDKLSLYKKQKAPRLSYDVGRLEITVRKLINYLIYLLRKYD